MKTYLNITWLLSGIFVALLCVSCGPDTATERSVKKPPQAEALTVFFTGNILGELKPCGCSGGQLGGLSRRAIIFDSVPKDKRLIVDTGSFVDGQNEQDLIKYTIILQALKELDYDLVSLSKEDIETGKNFEDVSSLFNIISYHQSSDMDIPVKFSKEMLLAGNPVKITIAAFDSKSMPIEQAGRLFASSSTINPVGINILILSYCDDAIIDFIAKRVPEVDCILRPSESDEPIATGNPSRRPLVFSVGRYGKYVSGLQITESPAYKGKPRLRFLSVPVTEQLKEADSLVQLYKIYQQMVGQRNLLEKYERFSLPNDLKYTGSASCKGGCHDYEYEKWSQKAHAHAYATLERVGSHIDPECVSCHVVGMEYDSGFISEQKSGHLKNVGCENCHGPGSKHVESGGVVALTKPKSGCVDCHTPEHSGGYAGNEGAFLEKIVHWREPKTSGSVK